MCAIGSFFANKRGSQLIKWTLKKIKVIGTISMKTQIWIYKLFQKWWPCKAVYSQVLSPTITLKVKKNWSKPRLTVIKDRAMFLILMSRLETDSVNLMVIWRLDAASNFKTCLCSCFLCFFVLGNDYWLYLLCSVSTYYEMTDRCQMTVISVSHKNL